MFGVWGAVGGFQTKFAGSQVREKYRLDKVLVDLEAHRYIIPTNEAEIIRS